MHTYISGFIHVMCQFLTANQDHKMALISNGDCKQDIKSLPV